MPAPRLVLVGEEVEPEHRAQELVLDRLVVPVGRLVEHVVDVVGVAQANTVRRAEPQATMSLPSMPRTMRPVDRQPVASTSRDTQPELGVLGRVVPAVVTRTPPGPRGGARSSRSPATRATARRARRCASDVEAGVLAEAAHARGRREAHRRQAQQRARDVVGGVGRDDHEVAAGREHAVELGERRRLVEEVERLGRDDGVVERTAGERQVGAAGVPADAGRASARLREHPVGGIAAVQLVRPELALDPLGQDAGPAADVEHATGAEPAQLAHHQVVVRAVDDALEQLGVVARGDPVEARATAVVRLRLRPRRGRRRTRPRRGRAR